MSVEICVVLGTVNHLFGITSKMCKGHSLVRDPVTFTSRSLSGVFMRQHPLTGSPASLVLDLVHRSLLTHPRAWPVSAAGARGVWPVMVQVASRISRRIVQGHGDVWQFLQRGTNYLLLLLEWQFEWLLHTSLEKLPKSALPKPTRCRRISEASCTSAWTTRTVCRLFP